MTAAWTRLAAEHWGRRACKLVCEPPLPPDSAFAAALACAMHERTTKEVRTQVNADGNYVCEPRSRDFLARPEDGSLDGYLARARGLANTGQFAVNHLKLQATGGWPVWSALVRLLAPLFERTGLPYGGVEASLFAGADRTFQPALQTWSKWEPTATKSGHLIFAIAGRARVAGLALDAGELAYAPGHEPFDAEVDGPTALLVVNFTAGTADARADRMARELALKATYPTIRACPHPLTRSTERAGGLPPAMREAAAQLHDYAQSTAFSEQLLAGWMCLETGLAFASPPPADTQARITKQLAVRAGPTLRWTTVGKRLLAAANGHALRFPIHGSVISLLDELTGGKPATVRELVERFSADEDGPGPEQLYELLQSLYEIRGIEPAPN